MEAKVEQTKELAEWQRQFARTGEIDTCARFERRRLEEQLEREKKRIRDAQHIRSVLGSVLHGWQEYRQHESPYRLVGPHDETVLAEELLSPGEVELARKKLLSVVPLKSVQHRVCPTCGPKKPLPVISIWSSDDVPEHWLMVCIKCETVHGPYSKQCFNQLFPAVPAAQAATQG